MLTIAKKVLKHDIISQEKTDIVVKSKDREASKLILEKYLKTNKINFKSVFKKSKSSSIDVLEVDGFKGDIIFKPIIQKGAGGVKFEKELETDLINYFNGVEVTKLKHQDVIKELEKVLNFSQKAGKGSSVKAEGSKNQKRQLLFANNRITISNSTGETLTDLTVMHPANKKWYLSLKMSATYYTLSASIFKFFLDKGTQVAINHYFGFDGQKMVGFGKEYACITKKPVYATVKTNLEDLLSQAYGNKVTIVHKKQPGNVMVSDIKQAAKVTVSMLNEGSYRYPEPGVRKYANIEVEAIINTHKYKVNFQFRGTTAADTGPKYLRILMERM